MTAPAPLREALTHWFTGFSSGAGITVDTGYLADNLTETLEANFTITARPAPPDPPCGVRYAGDLVCGQPAGHRVDVADPDTWHRHAAVRWCS